MSAPPPDSVRIGGMAGLAAGIVGAAVAIVVQFTTPVVAPVETSYPLSPGAFIWVELVLTLVQVGILAAIASLSASRVAGRSRAARIGLGLALLGFTVRVLAEFGFVFAATTDDTAPLPSALRAIVGVSTLLAAVGMILAGLGVLHAGLWQGWRRYLPLAVGIGTLLIVPPLFIEGADNWVIALWCLLIAALGFGLATRPGPALVGSAPGRVARAATPGATAAPQASAGQVSAGAAPGQDAPGQTTSGQVTPGLGTPGAGTTGQGTPNPGTPGSGTVGRGTPGEH